MHTQQTKLIFTQYKQEWKKKIKFHNIVINVVIVWNMMNR